MFSRFMFDIVIISVVKVLIWWLCVVLKVFCSEVISMLIIVSFVIVMIKGEGRCRISGIVMVVNRLNDLNSMLFVMVVI